MALWQFVFGQITFPLIEGRWNLLVNWNAGNTLNKTISLVVRNTLFLLPGKVSRCSRLRLDHLDFMTKKLLLLLLREHQHEVCPIHFFSLQAFSFVYLDLRSFLQFFFYGSLSSSLDFSFDKADLSLESHRLQDLVKENCDVEKNVEHDEGDKGPACFFLALKFPNPGRKDEEGVGRGKHTYLVDQLLPVCEGGEVRTDRGHVADHEHRAEDLAHDLSIHHSWHDCEDNDHPVASEEEDHCVVKRRFVRLEVFKELVIFNFLLFFLAFLL